ncbi:unnamed protein product [Caenorhabditis auriculariae]|uniref:Secreted protein n=1 Tax=Caenorhabditis auriculariae TaxID=2777116 RepID=A0A8S1HCQ0_9PELO|nr:unnamed protein product [Caenorhabditis auriculariae]
MAAVSSYSSLLLLLVVVDVGDSRPEGLVAVSVLSGRLLFFSHCLCVMCLPPAAVIFCQRNSVNFSPSPRDVTYCQTVAFGLARLLICAPRLTAAAMTMTLWPLAHCHPSKRDLSHQKAFMSVLFWEAAVARGRHFTQQKESRLGRVVSRSAAPKRQGGGAFFKGYAEVNPIEHYAPIGIHDGPPRTVKSVGDHPAIVALIIPGRPP